MVAKCSFLYGQRQEMSRKRTMVIMVMVLAMRCRKIAFDFQRRIERGSERGRHALVPFPPSYFSQCIK